MPDRSDGPDLIEYPIQAEIGLQSRRALRHAPWPMANPTFRIPHHGQHGLMEAVIDLTHVAAVLPAKGQRASGLKNGRDGSDAMVECDAVVVFLASGGRLDFPLPSDVTSAEVIDLYEAARNAAGWR